MARQLCHRIPAKDLPDNVLYYIKARNSCAGIYCSRNRSFEIARSKFGRDCLFQEFDWDRGPPHGTAIPLKMIEEVPPFVNSHERLLYLLSWRALLSEDDQGDWHGASPFNVR
jgi:hypothetical protein